MCSRHLLSFRDERRRLLRERISNTRCEDAGGNAKRRSKSRKTQCAGFSPPCIPLFQRNVSRTRKAIHHARLHQPPHQAFCRYRSKCDSLSSARSRGNHAAMIQVVDFRESTVSNSSTSAKKPAMRLNERKTRTIGALERTRSEHPGECEKPPARNRPGTAQLKSSEAAFDERRRVQSGAERRDKSEATTPTSIGAG